MKKKKGITLLALIVTIIVMLILVAVAVSMTFGNNGVISEAKKAEDLGSRTELVTKMKLIYSGAKLKATREGREYTYDYFLEEVENELPANYGITGENEEAKTYAKNDPAFKVGLIDIFNDKKIEIKGDFEEDDKMPENLWNLPNRITVTDANLPVRDKTTMVLYIDPLFDFQSGITDDDSRFGVRFNLRYAEGTTNEEKRAIREGFKIKGRVTRGGPFDLRLTEDSQYFDLYKQVMHPSEFTQVYYAEGYLTVDYDGPVGKLTGLTISPEIFPSIGVIEFGNLGTKTNVTLTGVSEVFNPIRFLNNRKATGFELLKPEPDYVRIGTNHDQERGSFTPYLFSEVPEIEHIDFDVHLNAIHPNIFAKLKNLKTMKKIVLHKGIKIPEGIFRYNKELSSFKGFYNISPRKKHPQSLFENNPKMTEKNVEKYYNRFPAHLVSELNEGLT